MNIFDFIELKKKKKKISMITCYDYSFAQIIAETDIHCVLVGDSLAMTMHGFPTTINASTDLMSLHTKAVARGCPNKFIVGDLPFLSYRKSLDENMLNVEKIMKAGAHAIKLEGALGNLSLIEHITQSGIPVMGHLGLTPQSIHQLGGFKVQGKSQEQQNIILKQAQDLEQAGCFSLVLECIPNHLAQKITEKISIPTIGIGAGIHCDGQVLVLQDLLGMNQKFKPKFLRQYLNGFELIKNAVNQYHQDVSSEHFPSAAESYE